MNAIVLVSLFSGSLAETVPRAVDADGVPHHNVVSYDYQPIIERELAAFQAFMEHIRTVDARDHTIIMVQVENEIAVFGYDGQNQKLWRDHSPESNRIFEERGADSDLVYSAQRFSENWIRKFMDAGVNGPVHLPSDSGLQGCGT